LFGASKLADAQFVQDLARLFVPPVVEFLALPAGEGAEALAAHVGL
jgi:hypothetical protein